MRTSQTFWTRLLFWSRTVLLIALSAYGAVMLVGLLLSLLRINHSLWEFGRTLFWLGMLPVPLAFLLAMVMRSRRLLLLLLIPLVAWGIHYVPIFAPKNPTAPANSQEFTLLTFNVLTPDEGKEQLLEIIRDANADIVLLQELSLTVAEYLHEGLSEQYPHQALHGQEWKYFRGQGVLSKYPILEDDYWILMDLFPETHGHQRVEVNINGETVVIYNSHPWPSFTLSLYDGTATYDRIDRAHRQAIETIFPMIQAETEPVLLVGDMNMSQYYEEYNWITQTLTDSYREAASGLGFTYPACGVSFLGEIIRIDYVFHSSQMTALEADVLDSCPASDHDPVLVRLALHGD